MRPFAPLLASLLYAALPADAAVFTVGGDAACTHANLLSAISAASTNGPALDEIRLATNITYSSIVAPVASQNLTVRGGYTSCSDTSASGRTIVRGTTAGASGTFQTSGNAASYTLVLENLELRDGGNATRRGGALRIEGRFAVTLRNTSVNDNLAGRGGGIYIDGSDDAELVIDVASRVASNTAAVSGGGIYCQENGSVLLEGVVIANEAQDGTGDPIESGNGGGVALYDCFMNQESSPGFIGVLANEAARHGGGYYVRDDSDLFVNGDAVAPALVANNTAGDTGGGIAVYDPLVPVPRLSQVEISNSQVEGNAAPRGGGIGQVAGGSVRSARTLAAGACHNDTFCSTLSGNDYPTGTSSGRGCAAYVGVGGRLRLRGTRVEDNCPSGSGSAFRQAGISELLLDSTVVADNEGANPFVLEPDFDGTLQIAWSTITRNYATLQTGMFLVPDDFVSTGTLRVYGTLLGEPFQYLVVDGGGPGTSPPPMTFEFDCLVVDPVFALAETTYRSVRIAPPYGMVAPATGNFRLASGTALPVDWCDESFARRISADAGGNAAIYDAPRANQFGAYDIGAYEFVVPGAPPVPLFANGFE